MEWDDGQARIWRGRGSAAAFTRAVIPTGFRELDRSLPGGGWPLGALTEVFVDGYGIGELGLLMPALAALTKADPAKPKKWVAWVAPPFVPYAPALQQHDVNIERLLMIHPTSGNKSRLWAIEQAVRSGSSAGVLAWVADAGMNARGKAVGEDVILRRLQLAAEDQGCWVLLFRPASARLQRSPAALRIRVSRAGKDARDRAMQGAIADAGRDARDRAMQGAIAETPAETPAAVRVEIIKCRGGRPGIVDVAGFTFDAEATASPAHQ